MYPVPAGLEIHYEGVSKIYVGMLGEEEEKERFHVGVAGNHYLILIVSVGFNHFCNYVFVGYHRFILPCPAGEVKSFFHSRSRRFW